MSYWLTLRKTGVPIYISYAGTFSNNLFAENIRLRTSPKIELGFDLSKNLRKKSKQSNSYVDARSLANGDIDKLEMVQIDDAKIIQGIIEAITQLGIPAQAWVLTVELNGERSFHVEPQLKSLGSSQSLILRVT